MRGPYLAWSNSMEAIITKYVGPTSAKGSHVTAKCETARVRVPYDDELGTYENHAAAMQALCARQRWDDEKLGGRWHAGEVVGGYAWVFVPVA
jgi:hypothetical protein